MDERVQSNELVCSLNDEEFRNRRALVRDTLLPHLTRTERLDSGLTLTFPDTPELRSSAKQFVDLEHQCCGFLEFAMTHANAELVVTIGGSEEAQQLIDMFAAFMANDGRRHAD